MITKFKIFESNHKDLDPYDEEEWYDSKPDGPAFWEEGDIIICVEPDNRNRLKIGEEYKIFDITKPSGHSVWVNGINTYFNTKHFKLKK